MQRAITLFLLLFTQVVTAQPSIPLEVMPTAVDLSGSLIFIVRRDDCVNCNLSISFLARHAARNYPGLKQYLSVLNGTENEARTFASRIDVDCVPILVDLKSFTIPTPACIVIRDSLPSVLAYTKGYSFLTAFDSLMAGHEGAGRMLEDRATNITPFNEDMHFSEASDLTYDHETGAFLFTDAFNRAVFYISKDGNLSRIPIIDSVIASNIDLKLPESKPIRNLQSVYRARFVHDGEIGVVVSLPYLAKESTDTRVRVGKKLVFLRYTPDGTLVFAKAINNDGVPPMDVRQWSFSPVDTLLICPYVNGKETADTFSRHNSFVAFSLASDTALALPIKRSPIIEKFGFARDGVLYRTYFTQRDTCSVFVEEYSNSYLRVLGTLLRPKSISRHQLAGSLAKIDAERVLETTLADSVISSDSLFSFLLPAISGVDYKSGLLLVQYIPKDFHADTKSVGIVLIDVMLNRIMMDAVVDIESENASGILSYIDSPTSISIAYVTRAGLRIESYPVRRD